MTSGGESARGPGEQVVSLEVPARAGYVVLARLALSAVCRLTPLPDDDVADLKLAVTEAANTLVGDGEAEGEAAEAATRGEAAGTRAAGPLRPVEHPAEEGALRFRFDLGERELRIEIESHGETGVPDEERELSHAIIAATVDEFRTSAGSIQLRKRLVGPAE